MNLKRSSLYCSVRKSRYALLSSYQQTLYVYYFLEKISNTYRLLDWKKISKKIALKTGFTLIPYTFIRILSGLYVYVFSKICSSIRLLVPIRLIGTQEYQPKFFQCILDTLMEDIWEIPPMHVWNSTLLPTQLI